MNASVRALLTGIVDYAGMFPPAKLPLEAAIREYAAARRGPGNWILARFVVPAARLGEFAPLHDEVFAGQDPVPFTVLGRGGVDADAFLAGLDRDFGDLEMFLERHGAAVRVEACELKIPAALLESHQPQQLFELFERTWALVDDKAPVPLQLFWEGTYGPDWHRAIKSVIGAIAEHRARRAGSGRPQPGFKLRTGGTESSAIPPVEQVALALAECRDTGVPFKTTAGLHHAVRRLDHELLAKTHGFLNVFCGAALAHARRLDELTLAEVLADEDPAAFVFDGETFRWRDQSVTAAEMASARAELACSFGSCSLAEPLEDLQALGLA